MKYEVKTMPSNPARFAVYDCNGNCVNDANGYGFKDKQGAFKAMYFLTNRKSIEAMKNNAVIFWKRNKSLAKKIRNEIEWRQFEALQDGEKFTPDDAIQIALNYCPTLNPDYVKYL